MKRDEDLVREVCSGSPVAFNELVERYEQRLQRFLTQRVGNLEDARELTQEVFLRAYMAIERYDSAYRFSTWIYRIAINLSIDFLRRKRIKFVEMTHEYPDGEQSIPGRLVSRERFTRLIHEIGLLPEEFRLVIEMRHFLEMSYQAISETLNLPLGTVKNRIFRARKALAAAVEDDHAV